MNLFMLPDHVWFISMYCFIGGLTWKLLACILYIVGIQWYRNWFEMQTCKNPDSCFGISVLKTDWTQSKFAFCKWGPVRFLWSKTSSLWTRSRDLHPGRVSLWVGCTMLWTSCSAFGFFVFATNSRMNVKDLKSWIILFPESSFIYLRYWTWTCGQSDAPWHHEEATCCSESLGLPVLYPRGCALWDKGTAMLLGSLMGCPQPLQSSGGKEWGTGPPGTCTLSDTTIMIKNSQVVTF